MYFPILTNWISPFTILGCLVVFFIFNSNLKRHFCKQTVDTFLEFLVGGGSIYVNHRLALSVIFAASDLVLHCLLMSHKKDARRIWVKLCTQNCS